jgi:redox-sensitive bicupin YhaK (pirin superfamily)
MATAASAPARRLAKVFRAPSQTEGAGFVVQRPFPSRELKDAVADTFLMLDEFGPAMVNKKSPGAPWHPHRGFDTVTYIRHGSGAHQDSMGNKGVVGAGEVQWMRAGSGVIHDEGTPDTAKDGEWVSHGFQLWVNLPQTMKMAPPNYEQLTKDTFAWRSLDGWYGSEGASCKLIAGRIPAPPTADADAEGATAAAADIASPFTALAVPVLYADVEVRPGGRVSIPVPDDLDTTLVYVYRRRACR